MGLTEEANQEIEALQSIYENIFTYYGVTNIGIFKIEVQLPPNYYLKTDQNEEIPIKYLPPLELYTQYNPEYPDQPPGFCLTCSWLTPHQLSQLCKKLDELWRRGEVVLFKWISWLGTDTLTSLGLQSCLDLSELLKMRERLQTGLSDMPERPSDAGSMVPLPRSRGDKPIDMRAMTDINIQTTLKSFLINHSKDTALRVFNTSLIECNICLDTKEGVHFTRFSPCDHLFCKACCKTHFETHIQDGDVTNMTCPAPNCPSTAHLNQIQELVSQELFARYDKLLLNFALISMKDVVVCPRKNCGISMVVDVDSNMATCPNCEGTFCMFCKRTYHGLEPCKINQYEKQKLVKLYQSGTDAEKSHLERTYGKKTLKVLVDECLSEEFISSNSKKCPNCGTNIIKEYGCHKMWCSKCQTHFCWLCMSILDTANPYRHFNIIGGSCFRRLFHGIQLDQEEAEEEEDWQFGQYL